MEVRTCCRESSTLIQQLHHTWLKFHFSTVYEGKSWVSFSSSKCDVKPSCSFICTIQRISRKHADWQDTYFGCWSCKSTHICPNPSGEGTGTINETPKLVVSVPQKNALSCSLHRSLSCDLNLEYRNMTLYLSNKCIQIGQMEWGKKGSKARIKQDREPPEPAD